MFLFGWQHSVNIRIVLAKTLLGYISCLNVSLEAAAEISHDGFGVLLASNDSWMVFTVEFFLEFFKADRVSASTGLLPSLFDHI